MKNLRETHREKSDQLLKVARSQTSHLQINNNIRPYGVDWCHAYYAFLAEALASGYEVCGFDQFSTEEYSQRKLFIEHDIHWRDIPGGLVMMDIERQLGVRSSYYIMWNYRPFDYNHADDYLLFKTAARGEFDLGLHDAVMDQYFFRDFPAETKQADYPELVRNQMRDIISKNGTGTLDPIDYLQPDALAPNILVFKGTQDLPPGIFSDWIAGMDELLVQRLSEFRQAFGSCQTIHQHGSYAVAFAWDNFAELFGAEERDRIVHPDGMRMREVMDDPKLRRKYGVHLLLLLLSEHFRTRTDEDIKRHGLRCDSGLVAARGISLYGNQFITDSYSVSSKKLRHYLTTGLRKQNAVFCLLHGAPWSDGHYNDLTELILAKKKAEKSQVNCGSSRLGYYRAALTRAASTRYKERFGPDWIADATHFGGYQYSIGGFQDRAQRVRDLLVERNAEHLLDDGYIVDLGGGLGGISSFLSCQYKVRRQHVIDIDKEYLAFQAGVYCDVGWDFTEVEQADFKEWQGTDELANLIISYGALEFIPGNKDLERLFTSLGSSLGPGGAFVANVWNHHYPFQGYSQAPFVQYLPSQNMRLKAARMLGHTPNRDFRSLSHKEWKRRLRRAGFKEAEVLYCDQKRSGFHFRPIRLAEIAKRTHIWIFARKGTT